MKLDWLDMGDEKQFYDYPDIYHAVIADDVAELRKCLINDPLPGGIHLNSQRSALDGMTPVHFACVHGSKNVFQEMLTYSKPFDPFVLDSTGRMAIDYALAFRRDDMARALQARMYPNGFAKLRQQGPKPPVGPA